MLRKKKESADTVTMKALQKYNPFLNFLLIRNTSFAEGIGKKQCPPSSYFLESAYYILVQLLPDGTASNWPASMCGTCLLPFGT